MGRRPAGWWDDPSGDPHTARWWDGTRWTRHTRPKNMLGPGDTSNPPAGAKSSLFPGAAIAAGALLAMLIIVGSGNDGPTQAPAASATPAVRAVKSATPTPERRDSRDDSWLACDHFRNVARDVSDGVLTAAEFRTKLREVDRDATIATPRIQRAARSMLAAATSGTLDEFETALKEMHEGCLAAGW